MKVRKKLSAITKSLEGRGFETVKVLRGSTYKDNSTVVVVPTRGKADAPDLSFIAHRVVQSWQSLISPMNQKRAFIFVTGREVGDAYNTAITNILQNPELSKWKYLLTLEDDNIQPPDAHIRLLESIEFGKYDAVSGLYFTKGEINMPMAYGDPEEFARTGVLDFKPRDVRGALANGHIMPVNGIAMGCALWRMQLFREVPGPWFVTVNDVIEGKGVQCYTQDLSFCEKAVRAGKRFAVDMRVRVGHMDTNSGIIY